MYTSSDLDDWETDEVRRLDCAVPDVVPVVTLAALGVIGVLGIILVLIVRAA